MKTHLLVIDPQVDFCSPNGNLPVVGADQDCIRLSKMIDRLEDQIDEIHVTLDNHNEYDIAHPVFWRNEIWNHPDIFTIITSEDIKNNVYTTSKLDDLEWAIEYVNKLETNGRYPLCLWKPHCITGTIGCSIESNVSESICKWSKSQYKPVNFVTKGENPLTEHYSAIRAEVPHPLDKNTWVNNEFLKKIEEADTLLVSGQALSHCVANTVSDIIEELGKGFAKKITLITDTCSNVKGFDKYGSKFIKEKVKLGMILSDSINILD